MKYANFLALSIASGLLLAAAWPQQPFTILIFIAFVPLLILAEKVKQQKYFFLYTFIATLLWNAATTWWIWNSTDVGSIVAIIANSLLMCIPLSLYFSIRKKGNKIGYLSFISFWMLFEYIHLNWQLSWPWLSLGNVFANQINWIQWYAFTGISGGTFWILISNICFKLTYDAIVKKQAIVLNASITLFAIVSPIIISFYTKPSETVINQKHNVVIVQPNINPYEKFNEQNASTQISLLTQLSESKIDSNTKLTIWPETALSVTSLQNEIASNLYYEPVFNLVKKYQNNTIISGIETFKNYGFEKTTKTARKANNGTYYDVFNAAVRLNSNDTICLYNKSKLVPGVESMPTFLNFLGSIFEQFGGTIGGYGKNDSSLVFTTTNNPYKVAPVICYESIYGEYVSTYVKRGANIITIITNDGWWGNTPGHQQHLAYAKLRAIENRRWIARSANTGISAVINNIGEIVALQDWDTVGVIKMKIPTTNTITFYTKYGDYLYQIIGFIGALILLQHCIFWVMKKIKK